MVDYQRVLDAYRRLLDVALSEDVHTGDVTTQAILDSPVFVETHLLAKSNGVLCGLDLLLHTLSLDGNVNKVETHHLDGDVLIKGEVVARVWMDNRSFLKYERTALNIIQHLSGIATETKKYVGQLEGTSIKLLDTRKTLPAYRLLQKYAVYVGGGENHRMGLYDMYLIKDNHIKASGGISSAITRVLEHKKKVGSRGEALKVEVECATLEQVREALKHPVDVIMLDNMTTQQMREAILLIDGKVKVEISGNVTFERLKELRELNVDYISMGALTHSVRAMDFSMKIVS